MRIIRILVSKSYFIFQHDIIIHVGKTRVFRIKIEVYQRVVVHQSSWLSKLHPVIYPSAIRHIPEPGRLLKAVANKLRFTLGTRKKDEKRRPVMVYGNKKERGGEQEKRQTNVYVYKPYIYMYV